MDDVRETASLPVKGASLVRYSGSGTTLAVAVGPVVQLYEASSLSFLMALRGHNGRVQQLSWAYNDATLLTCGADGAVYEWDLREGKRCREFLQKGSRLHCVSASKDGATLYAACQITETVGNRKETRCE